MTKGDSTRKATDRTRGDLPKGRVAVVDIGSNSVRLVVYHGQTRTPIQVFNEPAMCGLGRGLGKTGRLDPQGVEIALSALTRFTLLTRAMGVERLDLLATAAVRDAADGADFVTEIERRFDMPVTVLSGAEEAELAAFGVVSGWPEADGLMGDVGGGSLDLVLLDKGRFGEHGTAPLGMIYLSEASGGRPGKARKIIDSHLDKMPWIENARGRTFYPVGGSWRALALACMARTGYPLHIVDNYTLSLEAALDLSRRIARLSPDASAEFAALSARRQATAPLAALLMSRLLKRVRPKQVVFSAFGMREGFFFRELPEEVRRENPLVRACAAAAGREARFAFDGAELVDWTAPAFPDESGDDLRLRVAACHLFDIAWREHPEYRAEQGFHRVLKLPVAGLTHGQRVRLAISIFVRYGGDAKIPGLADLRGLIGAHDLEAARKVGVALRLATTLSGGVPGMLPRTRLEFNGTTLKLRLPKDGHVFSSEAVAQRFQSLAKVLGVKGWIVEE